MRTFRPYGSNDIVDLQISEMDIVRRLERISVAGQIQPGYEVEDMLERLKEEAPYTMMKAIEAGHEFVKREQKLTPALEIRWWEETQNSDMSEEVSN